MDNPLDNSCKLIYVFRYSGRAKSLHFRSAKVTNINFSRYNTNKPSKEGVMRINEITAKGKNIFLNCSRIVSMNSLRTSEISRSENLHVGMHALGIY